MYPLKHKQLPFADVVHHWRRFVEGSPANDLSDHLLAAFWRGELILRGGDGRAPLSREAALGALRDMVVGAQGIAPTPLALAFWAENEEGELGPQVRQLPNGGLEVDPRTRVRLPAGPHDRSEEVLEAAFATLAGVRLKQLPSEFQVAIDAQQVLKDDFARFCDLRRLKRPEFWFGPTERKAQPTRMNHDIVGFIRWFAREVQGPQRYAKNDYMILAKRSFTTLSDNRFIQEWARIAPKAWQKPGRRKGLLNLPKA